MARNEKPQRGNAGAHSTEQYERHTPAGWRAQLSAARFGISIECAALALGGAHG
jgi:hypothetical protein